MIPAVALKASKQAEQSRQTYSQINELIGRKKTKKPLTQTKVIDCNNDGTKTTLTTREEIETALINRNQKHSHQSLNTLFSYIPELADASNPTNPDNKIEDIINGEFVHSLPTHLPLSQAKLRWIANLQKQIDVEIDTKISMNDFINFFKLRKEKTASSHSYHHFGRYKVLVQMAEDGNTKSLKHY
jgi:hypothetical protein